MRKARWKDYPPLTVKADDTDLSPLGIGYVTNKGRVLCLTAAWVVSTGVYIAWGDKLCLFSTASGTWIETAPPKPDDVACIPLTRGALCENKCALLMEVLYHDHEELLHMLERYG